MIDPEELTESELNKHEESLLEDETKSAYDDADDNSGTPISVIIAVVTYCLYRSVPKKYTR